MLEWAIPGLVAFVVSYLGVLAMRPALSRFGMVDHPTSRSSHRVPTPRGAGVAMVVAFGLALGAYALLDLSTASVRDSILQSASVIGLLLGAVLVALVGLADDVRSQPVRRRLAGYVLAAVVLVAFAGPIDALRLPLVGEAPLGPLAWPVTVLWLVAVTNIFNFMDGIDGLAAGQAAIAAGFLAGAAALTGNGPILVLGASLSAAALGFLLHNLPPARVFMGDAGSTFLGFTLAGLAVLGAQAGPARISIYVAALLIAPFLFDATLTLVRRVLRGERWYQPHRSHLYQRLVQHGYSHLRVSLLYYLLAFVLGVLALVQVLSGQGASELFLLAALVPLVVLALWVRRVEASGRPEVMGMAKS